MSIKTAVFRSLILQNKYINFSPIAVRGSHYGRSDERYEDQDNKYKKYGKVATVALFSSVLIGSGITESLDNKNKVNTGKDKASKSQNAENIEAGQKRCDLPTFTAEEVSKHDNEKSFWVTYKHGVYDVTEFISSHPGGEQIMNAAGLSIEPFWNVYGMHKTPQVYKLLETYRIGNLHDDDIVDHSDEELWAKEPARDKRLLVKTQRPFNAEIPPEYQIQHLDTPNELFYVRQHMPVPEVDPARHTLTVQIEGDGDIARSFSLDDLQRFERTEVRAALMCAGNRRSEMDKVKAVKGISWQTGAISNAVWSGVLLRDVLLHCGVSETDTRGKHVILVGADRDATGTQFNTSIPLRAALDRNARVLLATHMNHEPLAPDHGRPLRAVVPGAPAVRSVKWLEKIIISEEESSSHWHRGDYRSFNPSVSWETADFSSAPPLYSLPVTSAFCRPAHQHTVRVERGHILVQGYAYSGGGAQIVRVDVTADGGATWVQAAPLAADSAPPPQHYSWTLWSARVPVTTAQKEVELWVKATDSNFNTQPEKFDHIWNIRGLLSNAYHKITVKLDHGKH